MSFSYFMDFICTLLANTVGIYLYLYNSQRIS